MTEDQKYQGALYKEKPNRKNQNNNQAQHKSDNAPPPKKVAKTMAHQAFVQDVGDDRDFATWADYDGQTDDERSPAEPLPEAPTPPPAVTEEHINVFDFLVATGQTPNASNMNLNHDGADGESMSLVRYEYDAKEYMVADDDEPLVQYGTGPVPTDAFVTPGPKTERRRSRDGDKKDKKRKRLHVDVPRDQEMTDAPPVLHSGLTGGLKNLMRARAIFPPSPDYSGGDNADASPASPLKKTKHSKNHKGGHVSNSIFDMITGGKSKKKEKKEKKKKSKSSHRHREKRERSEQKLIEYREKDEENENQVVLFKPRSEVFFTFITKGPDSDRGCSVSKALRRYHREREASGSHSSKLKEERELFRSLRLRRNDRGEIVVFGLEDD